VRAKEVNQSITISVIDNGIGIKDDYIQNIYQMFSKAARDHQNLGLGLYIVKQAVEKLNGSVMLKENTNHYTEFEVRIPLSHQSVPVYS
jgi:signal transduction histidine kinase